jgi:hypothetical protein
MTVQARFYVSKIEKTPSDYIGVTLLPVVRAHGLPGAEGNIDWSKYTPSGNFQMNVSTSTGAAKWFEDHIGKDVAITFEDVAE